MEITCIQILSTGNCYVNYQKYQIKCFYPPEEHWSILVYKFRPERTSFNMYAENVPIYEICILGNIWFQPITGLLCTQLYTSSLTQVGLVWLGLVFGWIWFGLAWFGFWLDLVWFVKLGLVWVWLSLAWLGSF